MNKERDGLGSMERGQRALAWEVPCAIVKLQGTWLPPQKARDYFLFLPSFFLFFPFPTLHHSGHGSRHSKSQDYSSSVLWGVAWVCQEAALARTG